MPKLAEVCRYVRSKNAGPFWLTVDIFFKDRSAFDTYSGASGLTVAAIARIFGADPVTMKRFALEDLAVVKFSFPSASPQGGRVERDLHGDQHFVALLALTPPERAVV